MTATCTSHVNGRTDRRTLAAQIDRFDSMLDGLDAALLGAVKDAVSNRPALPSPRRSVPRYWRLPLTPIS